IGVITLAVVGLTTAIIALSGSTEDAKETQEALNEALQATLDLYDIQKSLAEEKHEEQMQQMQDELAAMQARGASQVLIAAKEKEIAAANKKFYGNQKKNSEDLIDKNRKFFDSITENNKGLIETIKTTDDVSDAVVKLAKKLDKLKSSIAEDTSNKP